MTQSTIVIPTSPAWVQWRCVESIVYHPRLLYGRFGASPIGSGEAISLGAHLRNILMGHIQGTCITSVKVLGASHEYFTLPGVRESIDQIVLNLRGVVLKGRAQGLESGSLKVAGPGKVLAAHLKLPSWIVAVDASQLIATLDTAVEFQLELTIETGVGARRQDPPSTPLGMSSEIGVFLTKAVFSPIRRVNCTVHSLGDAPQSAELLFLEIETNGALTPSEARDEAFQLLVAQVVSALGGKALREPSKTSSLAADASIDQLGISSKVYGCLKRANVYTLTDLLSCTRESLLRINGIGERSIEQIIEALQRQGLSLLPPPSNQPSQAIRML